jgi:hypothetical protein
MKKNVQHAYWNKKIQKRNKKKNLLKRFTVSEVFFSQFCVSLMGHVVVGNVNRLDGGSTLWVHGDAFALFVLNDLDEEAHDRHPRVDVNDKRQVSHRCVNFVYENRELNEVQKVKDDPWRDLVCLVVHDAFNELCRKV